MEENKNTWIWATVIALVLLLFFFGPWMLGNFGEWNMMGMMYGGNYGYSMMFFGWIAWILFIALIIAAIYWLIKSANRK